MSKKKRRTFTAEQKAAAVEIAKEAGDTPLAQVAEELGLSESALRNWIRQQAIDERGDPNGRLSSEERAELCGLRKELKRVTMERDFLKKTSAYFAKETTR